MLCITGTQSLIILFMGGFTLQSYFTLQRFHFFILLLLLFFLRFQHGNEKSIHSKNTRQDNLERKSTSEKGFLRTPPCWQVNLGSQLPKVFVPSIQQDVVEILGPYWHESVCTRYQGYTPIMQLHRVLHWTEGIVRTTGILLWSSASSKTQVGFKMN